MSLTDDCSRLSRVTLILAAVRPPLSSGPLVFSFPHLFFFFSRAVFFSYSFSSFSPAFEQELSCRLRAGGCGTSPNSCCSSARFVLFQLRAIPHSLTVKSTVILCVQGGGAELRAAADEDADQGFQGRSPLFHCFLVILFHTVVL